MTEKVSILTKVYIVACASLLLLTLGRLATDRSLAVPNYYVGEMQITGTYTSQDISEILRLVRGITQDRVHWIAVPLDGHIAYTSDRNTQLPTHVAEVFTYTDGSTIAGSRYKVSKTDGAWQVVETSFWIR